MSTTINYISTSVRPEVDGRKSRSRWFPGLTSEYLIDFAFFGPNGSGLNLISATPRVR